MCRCLSSLRPTCAKHCQARCSQMHPKGGLGSETNIGQQGVWLDLSSCLPPQICAPWLFGLDGHAQHHEFSEARGKVVMCGAAAYPSITVPEDCTALAPPAAQISPKTSHVLVDLRSATSLWEH